MIGIDNAKMSPSHHDVMSPAYPLNQEWLRVVLMMAFNAVCGTTNDARLFLNKTSLYVGMKVRSAIGFSTFFWRNFVRFPELPHRFCVAFRAISLPYSGFILAFGTRCHDDYYMTWNGEINCR